MLVIIIKRSCSERVEIAKLLNFSIMKLTNFFQIFPLKVDLVGKKVSGFAIAMTAKLGALFLVEDLPDSLKVCSNCRTSFGRDVMTAFNVIHYTYMLFNE